ncbi:polyphosphate kinase 2 family protein [Sphingobacterium sp. lm-10]|uniref:PPK2 family polyphosphate kinase n=1 Tax=Sphingobacterium sp. lm-10 TaxID=2944904 RepID=UPI0020224CBE|nr:PPK2 family polyphosphate kinase [Sphingobacterium sp. lm-10]MCL7987196.1 polyphosphate kinase 2 family protein [Sphingobacterium sp. lm-10]
MSLYYNKFQAGSDFLVSEFPTKIEPKIKKKEAKSRLKKIRKELAHLQDVMYAHDKYSVLICIQGMDTSGKDSLIRRVFEKFNARGVVVHSFKVPTSKEYQHDYLWRHYIALPARGKFSVFNRTHYENVLVSRVHPHNLEEEHLPDIADTDNLPNDFWEKRFEQINNFEQHLVQNGTIILKYFLHISKDEQKSRILRRLNNEDKNWKFSPSDLSERKKWDEYMHYYEEAIRNTSKTSAPWYIVPADSKWVARYVVAKILLEVLAKRKDIKYPELPEKIADNIKSYKKELENE